MSHIASRGRLPDDLVLPASRDLYYGGAWHAPANGRYVELTSPGTGETLGRVAETAAQDVDEAVRAARAGFGEWRRIPPLERAKILKRIAEILRANARELAFIDAADCGNPVREMMSDAHVGAAGLDFFAGLVTEMKGSSIPMGPNSVNFSVREPYGVVAKIIPFNHPLMFCVFRSAAPLAAGNSVIVKPPEQSPLSALRFVEMIDGILPAGVFNLLPGGREAGSALVAHPDVARVGLTGSVEAGRAVMRTAAETLKPVTLELGGKNALIAFPDTDPAKVASAMVRGMNFTWCGQSCGSTSRAFVHEKIYEQVVAAVKPRCEALKPGIPTDMDTEMGAIINEAQFNRIMGFIDGAKSEGARLLCGGGRPDDPRLASGFYIQPTVFADVEPSMRIAREEIFGPVLAILPWRDEDAMLQEVNAVQYGLTCSIWTNDLIKAHRAASTVEAGYIWINQVSQHFLGAPFGGYKQSGIGREEGIEELLAHTQEKNININLAS